MAKPQKIRGIYTLDRRPFNHEWYGPMKKSSKSKVDANSTAKVVRKLGVKARVVKTDQGYTVFCNETDLKREEARLIQRKRR